MILLLLENKAKVNYSSETGLTALYFSAIKVDLPGVKMLIDAGATTLSSEHKKLVKDPKILKLLTPPEQESVKKISIQTKIEIQHEESVLKEEEEAADHIINFPQNDTSDVIEFTGIISPDPELI